MLLELSGHLFVVSSLDIERFDNESFFNVVRDWLLTYPDDATERFSMMSIK
jgi:hypothetical protein